MRFLSFFLLFFVVQTVNAQLVSGDLVDENRKMVGTSTFSMSDPNAGVIYFNIAVNRLGAVTSAKVDTEGTTVISTPSRVKATAFVKKLKFQEGTHFPEFHHARVKIVLYQPE